MSFEQLLLIGIVTGLILGAIVLLRGRNRRPRLDHSLPSIIPEEDEHPESSGSSEPSPEEAVKKLAETVGALRKLADLKDEEIARDETERSEQKTGWRPIAAIDTPRRRASDAPIGRKRTAVPSGTVTPMVTEVSQIALDPNVKMESDSAERLRMRVGQAFSPAAPVGRRDLFAGRTRQLESLVEVAFEKGQHAIIYGERGVGKTSLATVLALIFEDNQSKSAIRVNCDATDDFTSLWHKISDELEIALEDGNEDSRVLNACRRIGNLTIVAPNDVRRFLHQVGTERDCIILIDEFDTMTNETVTRLFADTIKTLSDQLVPGTLVMIGVADSLDELLAEHGSINRALVSIHMPRMSVDELRDTVRRGLQVLTMDIAPEALDLIAQVSQGFPHFTHLLGQAAARAAIDDRRPLITSKDALTAVQRVCDRVEAWIQESYERATQTSHDALYAQVLVAAALAPTDEKGFFAAADLREPLSAIMDKRYDIPNFSRQLNTLADADRGPVLIKTGSERKHRYRFVEPHMEPYVLMRSLTSGLVTGELLATFVRGSEAAPAGTEGDDKKPEAKEPPAPPKKPALTARPTARKT